MLCQETKGSGQYIYTYVGLSALLVSDRQGNAKALTRGTSIRTGSTFFCLYATAFLLPVKMELLAKRKFYEKTIYPKIHAPRSIGSHEHGSECRSH